MIQFVTYSSWPYLIFFFHPPPLATDARNIALSFIERGLYMSATHKYYATKLDTSIMQLLDTE
jgi:hypothetical protein